MPHDDYGNAVQVQQLPGQITPEMQFKYQQEQFRANVEMTKVQVHNAHIEALSKDAVSVANFCLPIALIIVAASYLIRKAIAAGIVRNAADNQAQILVAQYENDPANERPAAHE